MMFSFQNCQTGLKTGSVSDLTSSLSSKLGGGGISGNGEGYEGKLTAQFVREIPGTNCSEAFETLVRNSSGLTVETVDPLTCQKTQRLISSEVVTSSVGGILKSVSDGVFINTEFLANNYPGYQPQAWCQTKSNQNMVYDLLIFNKKNSSELIGTMYFHEKSSQQVRSVSDFSLNFERKDRLQIYSHPGLKLEILTDITTSSKLGTFRSSVHFMLDDQEYEKDLDCRLGNVYDGAVWPSTPLLAGDLSYLQFSKFNGKFYYNSKATEPSSFIYSYDPIKNMKEKIEIPLKPSETIGRLIIPEDRANILFRTMNSPNRFIFYDLTGGKNTFESPKDVQVLEIGYSTLGPWFEGRTITGVLSDGNFIYKSSYDMYFPEVPSYENFQMKLPPREKLLEFVLQDVSLDQQKVLFEVYFGEGAYYQSGILRIKTGNIYNDLAILDLKTGLIQLLNLGPQSGSGFHFERRQVHHIIGNHVFATVQNASVERLIQYDLSQGFIRILAERPRDLRNGSWSGFYFGSNKVIYSDAQNILQGIDLTNEQKVIYGPLVQVRGLSIDPIVLNDKLLYFRPLGSSNVTPVIWSLAGALHAQPMYESQPTLHFDESMGNFTSQEVKRSAMNGLFFGNKFIGPRGTLIIQADTDFDGKRELYIAELNQPQGGFKQISNRYLQYGGVTQFFVDHQENIYFFMKKNSDQFLLRWMGE
jgi:hypothetical protein